MSKLPPVLVQKTSFDRNEPGGGKPGDVGTKAAAPEAAGAAQCEHQGIFDLLWRYGAGEGYTQLIARQGTEPLLLRLPHHDYNGGGILYAQP